MRAAVGLLALGLLVTGCRKSPFPTATVGVGEHRVHVEVAHTGELRARGLMHRDSLPADQGMLFIYPDEKPRSFWMKSTRIPLDIAFADKKGVIVRIAQMEPFDTTSTASLYPTMYALEMNQGWFASKGITKGDTLTDLPDVEVR